MDRVLWAIAALSLAVLVWVIAQVRLPGNDVGYEPVQPVRFSHNQHVTELQIGCIYCHTGAESKAQAGTPSIRNCMTCHQFVLAASQAVKDEHWRAAREGRAVRRVISPEISKLLRAQGLDDQLKPDPAIGLAPIRWIKVVRFPRFAYYHHGAHARVGIPCQECHGDVAMMDRTRLARQLTMGYCVNCHRRANEEGIDGRTVHASIDCIACHR